MSIIPINAAVAADLARRGVSALEPYDTRVPNEWLALLEQLNGAGESDPLWCDAGDDQAKDQR